MDYIVCKRRPTQNCWMPYATMWIDSIGSLDPVFQISKERFRPCWVDPTYITCSKFAQRHPDYGLDVHVNLEFLENLCNPKCKNRDSIVKGYYLFLFDVAEKYYMPEDAADFN